VSAWTTATGGASLLGSAGLPLQPASREAPKQSKIVAGCLKLIELIT
jgi:hypothetical protein